MKSCLQLLRDNFVVIMVERNQVNCVRGPTYLPAAINFSS